MAALTSYDKLLFTFIDFLFFCLCTFDTLERFGLKVACTFDTFEQAVIFTFVETEIVSFPGRISMGDDAIDSLRYGGYSGDSSFGRRCVLRKALFYFTPFHLCYLHVLSILDFRESRKIADIFKCNK